MLRLVRPAGNKLIGRFKKEGNLKPKVNRELIELQKALDRATE